jgi:hypothetical protein
MLSVALQAQDIYQQVINRAIRAVPAEWSFPNDDAHIIMIRDYQAFLVSHPAIRERYEFRKLGTEDIAFSVRGSWPIFVNIDRHKAFLDACNRQGGEAVLYVLAGMLVHEQVHIRGDARESSALLEELLVDRRFGREGKLTAAVDLNALADQYLSALESERKGMVQLVEARK